MRNPRTYLLLILGCIAVSLFCLAYPFYVIRPFRSQGSRELAFALLVMQIRPYSIGACVIVTRVAPWTAAPKGNCLERVEIIKDYWFDWRHYNPGTSVAGQPRKPPAQELPASR